ncbi:hypothetical protein [Paraburkholderia bryophila]|uniref:Uncharacterized protein n=1 Tax=Paraburkholderia bryophila TaxID=420952 RepID=A0A7Y9WNN4_9BURK|nr:hypothetical protein [Paraburkholderia bryophila]NYH24222.1 hypothetical protein [Paraburkholderia bryophila]
MNPTRRPLEGNRSSSRTRERSSTRSAALQATTAGDRLWVAAHLSATSPVYTARVKESEKQRHLPPARQRKLVLPVRIAPSTSAQFMTVTMQVMLVTSGK